MTSQLTDDVDVDGGVYGALLVVGDTRVASDVVTGDAVKHEPSGHVL